MEVRHLVEGNGVHICDECIDLSAEALSQNKTEKTEATDETPILTPREIDVFLSNYVISQADAKQRIAVAIFNHFKSIQMGASYPLRRSNILLVGPTGVGKTLLVKKLADLLHVPMISVSATTYTEAGYIGSNVEDMFVPLLKAAKHDRRLAEHGIVFIDEVDKLAGNSIGSEGLFKDVSGRGVQEALLTILQGTVVQLNTGQNPFANKYVEMHSVTEIDTSRILFIFAGAFTGIEAQIAARLARSGTPIDLRGPEDSEEGAEEMGNLLRSEMMPIDLINYGFIPEFVGRMSSIVPMQGLRKSELTDILKSSKDSPVLSHQAYFAHFGIDLEFTEDAIARIADEAHRMQTGARALHAVTERSVTPTLYELPSRANLKRCVIDADVVENGALPRVFSNDGIEVSWKRDSIFVSYAHENRAAFFEMMNGLDPELKNDRDLIWSDNDIAPGTEWGSRIEEALLKAKVGILLVSPDFLASEYIVEKELAHLLHARRHEDVSVFWLLLEDCDYAATELSQIQALHPLESPVSGMSGPERAALWQTLSDRIRGAIA